jgi:hypothetical protein
VRLPEFVPRVLEVSGHRRSRRVYRSASHRAAEGGVGGATLGMGAAVDVAGVARGANENAVCDGVGQLSDPLEGHVI